MEARSTMRLPRSLSLSLLSALLFACGSSGHSSPTGSDGGGGGAGDGGGGGGGGGTDGGRTDARAAHDGSSGGSGDSGGTPDTGGGVPDTGPVTPTVSSWLGTNVNADLPFADITYMMKGFSPNGAAADAAASMLDANGYPLAGISASSSSDLGFLLPTGTYNLSFKGTGTLTVSGIGKLAGSWQTVSGEQRNTVTITGSPGSFGNILTLSIANTGSQTVTDVHLYLPGIDYDPASSFNPTFLAALTPFRAMRFMEWEAINGSTLADWADRPTSSYFGAAAKNNGEPYELITELINETGKDAWINVPEHATTDFINQFAAFMAKGLDFTRIDAARAKAGFTTPFQLIVENSNETWNQGFTAYATFLAAANAMPSRYSGTYTGTTGPTWMSGNASLMKVAQVEADRLVSIGQAFTTAFQTTGHADAIAPVLSGWALGSAYSDEGLSFVKTNYGDPGKYVSYVALAPYFNTADDSTTGSLSTLFPALETGITSAGSAYGDFSTIATTYGVKVAAYEGGQGLNGSTNEPVKHLAQFDTRMNAAYSTYLSNWKTAFGPALFMHFDLAGDPGLPESFFQYGFWGSLSGLEENLGTCGQNLPMLTGSETLASVAQYCPKYAALAAHVPE
jgi:hypothetical protein